MADYHDIGVWIMDEDDDNEVLTRKIPISATTFLYETFPKSRSLPTTQRA